jgi:hypothetical protein
MDHHPVSARVGVRCERCGVAYWAELPPGSEGRCEFCGAHPPLFHEVAANGTPANGHGGGLRELLHESRVALERARAWRSLG